MLVASLAFMVPTLFLAISHLDPALGSLPEHSQEPMTVDS